MSFVRALRQGLPLLLLSSAWANAAESTSAQVWNREPQPPFKLTAEGFVAPPMGGADFTVSLSNGAAPRYTPPAHATAAEIQALESAASYAARRYRELRLRAPLMKVQDGSYRMLLARNLGEAAASYGPGLESISVGQALDLARSDAGTWKGWEYFLRLSEAEGLDDPENIDWKIYPTKIASSLAHEIFHGVQASYPRLSEREGYEGWVGEGLPDAIAPYAIRGLRFLGGAQYLFPNTFRSGNARFGKALGLRPYDYPLDLSVLPPDLKIKPGLAWDKRRQLAGYMTSSFWRYLFEDIQKPGQEWTALSGLMLQPQKGRSKPEDLLLWADLAAKTAMPTFTHGLHDAFPDFIAKRVEYPDQMVLGRARQGVFKHPDWLGYLFQDGCKRIVLDDQNSTAKEELDLYPVAARCLRVKWNGTRLPESGAPTASVAATPLSGGNQAVALESLRLGHHGTAEGYLASHPDKATGARVRRFQPLDLDPLVAATTDGELVLTFSNVAKDVRDTVRQRYLIEIVVNTAKAQGQVSQPAEPEARRPASTGKASGKRRSLPSAGMSGSSDGTLSVGAAEGGLELDEIYDCVNGTLKMQSAGLLALNDRMRDKPVSSTLPKSCLALQQLANPRFAAQHRGAMSVRLDLPRIPTGTRGEVRGASVTVEWLDPALEASGSSQVSASTDRVTLTITEATVSFVRGSYTARFSVAEHGVGGSVSGDFVQSRADTDELMTSDDPLDYLSTDALLAFHYAGLSGAELQRQGREAQAQMSEGSGPPPVAGVGGGQGGAVALVEECRCDCAEFGALRRPEPSERTRCAGSCANYPNAGQCVIESQRRQGVADARIDQMLRACPSDCGGLLSAGPVCQDAAWSLVRACQTGNSRSLEASTACYLRLTTAELPEPQKSEMRRQLAEQLREMDAEARRAFLGGMLDAFQQAGQRCE